MTDQNKLLMLYKGYWKVFVLKKILNYLDLLAVMENFLHIVSLKYKSSKPTTVFSDGFLKL